ncbi:MAG: FAD binding domain-containing protein [Anaerolineaceae bacterium]|nr:FAD binding domain-containing protein [Anaerolineaceae bacterium]
MIVEYHRPKTLEETLVLLGRTGLPTYPLGGGTFLSQHTTEACAVVDLQSLGLSSIEKQGNMLILGATAALQSLYESSEIPSELKGVIYKEHSSNLRRTATIAGTLVTADESSPMAAALLALDAHLKWAPGEEEIGLGDWLPLRHKWSKGKLMLSISISTQAKLLYEGVSRTPGDRPIVCVAIGKWSSGRTRVVIGGFGSAPLLAMDGPEARGAESAIKIAHSQYIKPGNNKTYQLEITKILVHRLLENNETL